MTRMYHNRMCRKLYSICQTEGSVANILDGKASLKLVDSLPASSANCLNGRSQGVN